ncbi:hypothetical protein cyc_04794 [Cyclospora cayetanensis]|uniref:Uncharacterized protein n=1 Tax=Cyclospora cayetanensis TaxID=88456 RepID=A0A1D3D5N7_9EIME|nr:hypothetical protein cyc_04794 [Cyclospora cayetanensis]
MRRQERLGLTPQQAKEQELQRPHLRFRQQEQQSICPPTLSLAAIDACRRAVGTAQAFVAATPQLVGELQQLWQQRMGRCMASIRLMPPHQQEQRVLLQEHADAAGVVRDVSCVARQELAELQQQRHRKSHKHK